MENKTAMQKLLDYLEEDNRINSNAKVFQDALEEERGQINSAYVAGFYAGCDQPLMNKMINEYYNQTYSSTPINKEA